MINSFLIHNFNFLLVQSHIQTALGVSQSTWLPSCGHAPAVWGKVKEWECSVTVGWSLSLQRRDGWNSAPAFWSLRDWKVCFITDRSLYDGCLWLSTASLLMRMRMYPRTAWRGSAAADPTLAVAHQLVFAKCEFSSWVFHATVTPTTSSSTTAFIHAPADSPSATPELGEVMEVVVGGGR